MACRGLRLNTHERFTNTVHLFGLVLDVILHTHFINNLCNFELWLRYRRSGWCDRFRVGRFLRNQRRVGGKWRARNEGRCGQSRDSLADCNSCWPNSLALRLRLRGSGLCKSNALWTSCYLVPSLSGIDARSAEATAHHERNVGLPTRHASYFLGHGARLWLGGPFPFRVGCTTTLRRISRRPCSPWGRSAPRGTSISIGRFDRLHRVWRRSSLQLCQ